MRTAITFGLATLLSACSLPQPQLEHNARTPAGWEAFCFPVSISFLPGTDRISPETERTMPAIYDMHLRHTEWLQLTVLGGLDANDHATRDLAHRRAQAALRLLRRLGTRPERVEVRIFYDREVDRADRDVRAQIPPSPHAAVQMDWAAYVATMIPPDAVERNRALQRENPRLMFC